MGLFITAFIVGLSGAMMPGPLLSYTIAESARRGWTAGPLMVLGHGILELALVIGIMAGLSSFIQNQLISSGIALIGGAFLLYLGFSMSRQAARGELIPEGSGVGSEAKGMHPVLAGILISLSNPYWSVWWATIGLGYFTLALQSGGYGLAAFFTGHISADFLWYVMVAILVANGRRFLSRKAYNFILLACGLFLIGMGIYFICTGLSAAFGWPGGADH